MPRRFLPLLLFITLAATLALGLFLRPLPPPLPSPLIGKPLPAFTLSTPDGASFDISAFRGKVTLLNLFASWCTPCRAEHPLLMELAQRDDIRLTGIAWRDKAGPIQAWLTQAGNPYDIIGVDAEGSVTVTLGATGVPETYVIAPDGTVAWKFTGPLTQDNIDTVLLPLIAELERAP